MLDPIDIAIAAHEVCGNDEEHEFDRHLLTSTYYAQKIDEAGLDVSGQQVIDAILSITGYDGTNKWTGHPHPDLVIAHLEAEKTVIE